MHSWHPRSHLEFTMTFANESSHLKTIFLVLLIHLLSIHNRWALSHAPELCEYLKKKNFLAQADRASSNYLVGKIWSKSFDLLRLKEFNGIQQGKEEPRYEWEENLTIRSIRSWMARHWSMTHNTTIAQDFEASVHGVILCCKFNCSFRI